MVASLGNRVRSDEIDTAITLMQEAGVQWQREEILWEKVQTWPGGPFHWSGNEHGFYNYDYAIEAQAKAGINMIGLLDYNPSWVKGSNPPTETWIEDWAGFVYTTVARYGRDRGLIKHWELWNEPNVKEYGYDCGLHTIEDFIGILKVGHAAVKAADPDAKVVMGGISGILKRPQPFNYDWLDYLERVGQAGGWEYVDILAIHIYHPLAPEQAFRRFNRIANLRGELSHLDTLQQRYGPKPVWITEFGLATLDIWPGVGLQNQALFLVRSYVLLLAHPHVEKIFWYDFRDDIWSTTPYEHPVSSLDANFHFGLLRRAYPLDPDDANLRKPSFLAYRTMTSMLSGLHLQNIREEGFSGLYWYRFGNRHRRVDVLWRTRTTAPVLQIACACRQAQVHSWNGQQSQVIYPTEGMLTVRMGPPGIPMYIEYETEHVPLTPARPVRQSDGY
jgi:hypothetical protein